MRGRLYDLVLNGFEMGSGFHINPTPPEDDPVDEASEESFPASDAPSTWSREE